MDIAKNIAKYKASFNALSKNPENSFQTYLEKNKLTLINLLLEMGINPALIAPFNYEEITRCLEDALLSDEFPHIDSLPKNDDLNRNNLSIYTKENGVGVVLSGDSIRFHASYDFKDTKTKIIKYDNFCLNTDHLRRSKILIEIIPSEDRTFYAGSNNYVDFMRVTAKEEEIDSDGTVLNSYEYEIKFNQGMTHRCFSQVHRALQMKSILNGLNKIIELIKEEKISRDTVEIITVSGLKK